MTPNRLFTLMVLFGSAMILAFCTACTHSGPAFAAGGIAAVDQLLASGQLTQGQHDSLIQALTQAASGISPTTAGIGGGLLLLTNVLTSFFHPASKKANDAVDAAKAALEAIAALQAQTTQIALATPAPSAKPAV